MLKAQPLFSCRLSGFAPFLLLCLAWRLEQSHALLPFGNKRLNRVPPPSHPSVPSKWLVQVLRNDSRNITNFWDQNASPSWFSTETHVDESNSSKKVDRKSWIRGWRHARAFLLVQAIRFILVFHLEGPVLRWLSNRILFEIVQECMREEARPRLLRVVATELDRRRQGTWNVN